MLTRDYILPLSQSKLRTPTKVFPLKYSRYLDSTARSLLTEARGEFVRLQLDCRRVLRDGRDCAVFLCRGDRIVHTVAAQLTGLGLDPSIDGPIITIKDLDPSSAAQYLAELVKRGPADPLALADRVKNKQQEKFDSVLGESLLSLDYAARALDTKGAHAALEELLTIHTEG